MGVSSSYDTKPCSLWEFKVLLLLLILMMMMNDEYRYLNCLIFSVYDMQISTSLRDYRVKFNTGLRDYLVKLSTDFKNYTWKLWCNGLLVVETHL